MEQLLSGHITSGAICGLLCRFSAFILFIYFFAPAATVVVRNKTIKFFFLIQSEIYG